MEDKEMNGTLKAYFSQSRRLPERGAECPSVESLGKYAAGALDAGELHGVSSHVKSCAFCNELVEGALIYSAYGKHIKYPRVHAKIKNKVKFLHPGYKRKESGMVEYFKRNVWFVLFLVSLTTSFFVKSYFWQFLILSVVFGLKWVFNRESTRALIMVYNAWRKHDKSGDKELEDIFKSRL